MRQCWRAAPSIFLGHGRDVSSPLSPSIFSPLFTVVVRDWDEAGGRIDAQQHQLSVDLLLAALKACSASKDLESGKRIHSDVFGSDDHHQAHQRQFSPRVHNSFVTMYGKCESMDDARSIFDAMPIRDLVSWNTLAFGYAANGQPRQALEILDAIKANSGFQPDARSFLAALLACSGLADEETAKELDGKLVKASSLERTVAIHAEAARMPSHTVVSWSTIIQGYANNDEDEMALAYYERMQARGIPPDNRTFSALLAACLSLASREAGREIDGKVVKVESLRKGMSVQSQMDKFECGSNVILASSLVHFYARCGRLDKASAVFDAMLRRDEIVWNTLIMGYVENGEYDRALELFSRMRLERRWSSRAFVAALMTCSKVAASEKGVEVDGRFVKMDTLQKGMQIHREAVGCGCDSDEFVASSLLDMYAKCGSMMDARAAFDKMASHDVVSWTSLILGYAESGQGQVALDLFSQITENSPVTPNHLTCIAALTASGNLPSLETGKRTHGCILRRGLETDFMIESSVLDCYCKCGSMDNAELVFSSMATRRLVTWSALIAGYSRQGDTTLVFQHFQQLRDEGLQPNGVTVLSVLTSCSHAGLVDKGKKILDAMLPEFGVKPEMDHYHCVLDLLSRANRLDDAVKLARSLRYEDNYFAWTTILSGACKWNNLGVGEVAFESLMKVEDKDDDAAFVLMANLYGRAGLWDKRARISAMRKGNFKLSW